MGGVFVNYRTGDGDWAATLIARELVTRFGAPNVFLASKSIRPGEDFAEQITDRLRECDVMLAVIGARWRTILDHAGRPRVDDPDDWVNQEIAEALKHGLRMIPVLLDGVPRLSESDVPTAITRLARCQYLRLHHRNDDRDIARLIEELVALVPGFQEPASGPRPLLEDDSAECPYRGLQPFRAEDAAIFRGRDREISRLTHLVAHRKLTVVAGASGSGKSSLVRAGLWPALRREDTAIAVFRPIAGVPPLRQLAYALRGALGPGWQRDLDQAADELRDHRLFAGTIADQVGELVLCVDQFEELAGTDPAAARELFDLVSELVEATPRRPGGPPALRAVFTMRSATVDRVLTPELVAVLEEATVYVRVMAPAELRAAITEPLAATGRTEFEPGLVERIVAEARDAPGQLPLVEFTLTRLWESRRGGLLTHEAYDEMGGVAGALAAYAEEFFTERLTAVQRPLVERLLVQLVRPGEDGSFRLVPATLDRLPPELREPAAELGHSRLVVVRQDVDQPEVVALAHEALVDAWPRLRELLTAAQDFRTWQERLRVTLEEWQASARDPGGLLRGAPLSAAEEWLTSAPADLTATEREYIVTSRRHQLRSVGRWRVVTGLVAALALAASVLSVVVIQRSGELADQVHDANATVIAQEAEREADEHPWMALQFALAAWRESPGNSKAYEALLNQYLKWRFTERLYPADENGELRTPQASVDGRVMAMLAGPDAHKRVLVWQGLPERSERWVPTPDIPSAFALSPDGRLLAVGTFDGTVSVWSVADHTGPYRLRRGPSDGAVSTLRFDADSRFLAATTHRKRVEVWDAQERRPLPSTISSAASFMDAVPLRGGNAVLTLVGTRTSGDLTVRDRATGAKIRSYPKGSIVVGAGSAVASCEPAGLRVRDMVTGADRAPSPSLPRCDDGTPPMADATGQFLCVTSVCDAQSGRHTYLQWSTGRRYTIRAPLPFSIDTAEAGFVDSKGGLTMLVHNGDTLARVRALRPDPADVDVPHYVTTPAFAPGSRWWLSAQEDARLVLADAGTGRRLAEVPGQQRTPNLAFTPSGGRALSAAGAELRVYRTPGLRIERVIKVPNAPATGRAEVIALSESAAAFLHDGVLTWWNLDTGRPMGAPLPLAGGGQAADRTSIHARPGHPDQIVVNTETEVEVWDLGERNRIARFTDGSRALALDPSGTRIAMASPTHGGVDIWDVDTARALSRIPGSVRDVIGFAGPLLMLTGLNNAQLWHWERAELIATFKVPDFNENLAWLHGDTMTYLQIGTDVAALTSLRFDPTEWFTRLCAISNREFTPRERDRLPKTMRQGRLCPQQS